MMASTPIVMACSPSSGDNQVEYSDMISVRSTSCRPPVQGRIIPILRLCIRTLRERGGYGGAGGRFNDFSIETAQIPIATNIATSMEKQL